MMPERQIGIEWERFARKAQEVGLCLLGSGKYVKELTALEAGATLLKDNINLSYPLQLLTPASCSVDSAQC